MFCSAGHRTLCRIPPGPGSSTRGLAPPRAPQQSAGARVVWSRRGSTRQTAGLGWCRGDTWDTCWADTRSGPAYRNTSYTCPRATCLRGCRSGPDGSRFVSLPPDRSLYTWATEPWDTCMMYTCLRGGWPRPRDTCCATNSACCLA